jgi:hypothetical protein
MKNLQRFYGHFLFAVMVFAMAFMAAFKQHLNTRDHELLEIQEALCKEYKKNQMSAKIQTRKVAKLSQKECRKTKEKQKERAKIEARREKMFKRVMFEEVMRPVSVFDQSDLPENLMRKQHLGNRKTVEKAAYIDISAYIDINDMRNSTEFLNASKRLDNLFERPSDVALGDFFFISRFFIGGPFFSGGRR